MTAFQFKCTGWSWDRDLQIIHADVLMTIEGEVLIDEPLCVDVGLPTLLLGLHEDVEPNRWAAEEAWRCMPFAICGCGDPECRGFSFRLRHLEGGRIELTELEERQGREPREQGSWVMPLSAYEAAVRPVGEAFLQFAEGLESYQPYYAETVQTVRALLNRSISPKLRA